MTIVINRRKTVIRAMRAGPRSTFLLVYWRRKSGQFALRRALLFVRRARDVGLLVGGP